MMVTIETWRAKKDPKEEKRKERNNKLNRVLLKEEIEELDQEINITENKKIKAWLMELRKIKKNIYEGS